MTKEKLKIIIDTDPGHDDVMAILMLLAYKNIEIKAITTVAGNSTIENVTRNTQLVLDLARRKIPLFSGAEKPLKRELIKADVHGQSGLDGLPLINVKADLNYLAVEKIIEIVENDPGEITILALGPLTNLAEAFLKKPDLPGKIKQIVIMGGAIEVCGNKNRVAEFNFFVDPEAAKIVMDSAVQKVLVPLDACNDIVMTNREIDRFENGKIGEALAKMMQPYVENLAKYEGISGAAMYDPLAAYYLINPAAFILQPMDVQVETEGELTRGMSVAERRAVADRNLNVDVAVKINANKFLDDFVKAVVKIDQCKQ